MKNDKFANQAIIENVSRRNLLKGIVGTGGLVIAAQFLPRSALADGGRSTHTRPARTACRAASV